MNACYLKTKTLQNRKPRKLFNEWTWNNWKNSQYNSKCNRKSCEKATLTWSKITLSITKTPVNTVVSEPIALN